MTDPPATLLVETLVGLWSVAALIVHLSVSLAVYRRCF